MTQTVKKGTGRPAAATRTAKAAQRSALPGDKAQIETLAKEKIEGMTVAQLRALARQVGPSTVTKLTKRAELIAALSKLAENAAAGAAPSTPAKTPAPDGKTATRPERRASSGTGKLARLTAALKPAGWDIKSKTVGDRIEATAKRDAETLVMVWVDGAYDYGASQYTNGSSNRKVRNLSEAVRLLGCSTGTRQPPS